MTLCFRNCDHFNTISCCFCLLRKNYNELVYRVASHYHVFYLHTLNSSKAFCFVDFNFLLLRVSVEVWVVLVWLLIVCF